MTLSHGEIKKLYFGNTVVSVCGCFWASKLGPSSTFHLLSSLISRAWLAPGLLFLLLIVSSIHLLTTGRVV